MDGKIFLSPLSSRPLACSGRRDSETTARRLLFAGPLAVISEPLELPMGNPPNETGKGRLGLDAFFSTPM